MEVNGAFRIPLINSVFMGREAARRANAPTVSAAPLFDWFKADKANRGRLRAAGYTDGRITNWRERGIPRAQVGAVAAKMGLSFEQYLERAGEPVNEVREAGAIYQALSDEALEIARAFDQMQPQTKERVREHVFIYSIVDKSFPWLRTGRPVSDTYGKFERWHTDNMQAQLALEAARIAKRGKVKS